MGIETALLAPIISGAGSIIGGALQGSAARGAARTQAQGAADARAQIQAALDKIEGFSKSYRDTGEAGLTRINEMLPYFSTPVTAEEIQNMPGYQFMVGQGTGAARQRFNAMGGGSNMDRAAQKFAADYTTSVALPALMQQKSDIFNRLAGIANIGQTAIGQYGQALGSGTGAMANLTTGAANALAGGQVGAANAYAGGLGGFGNSLWMYQLMRQRNDPGMGLSRSQLDTLLPEVTPTGPIPRG